MKKEETHAVIIPAELLCCQKIPANAKLLYGEILHLCNGKGICWASNLYLAGIFNVDKMTISKWIKSLNENGFIKCKHLKDNKRNIYTSKNLQPYTSNHLHIIREGVSKSTPSQKDKLNMNNKNKTKSQLKQDDFKMETKEWIDKKGHKHSRVSIDYES